MNYLTHSLRFLDQPWFVAGACTPDWLSVADRGVRLRTRGVLPFVNDPDPVTAEFTRGVLQHLHDDDWFHATRGFAEVTGEIAVLFRNAIGTDHPTPCSFLGHIVMEMLLDSVLMKRFPDALPRYYEAVDRVDPQMVQAIVNRCARGETERLALLIPRFQAEKFLDDYATFEGLAFRLNQVLKRVKLTPLEEKAIPAIAAGWDVVDRRFEDLLPPSQFVDQPVADRLST